MSYRNFAKAEHEKLELCKEQFAITHPNIKQSELIATVACDKPSSTFGVAHYYVCIFAKAVPTSPRLLFRGPQCIIAEDAINEFLQLQSEEIGEMVNRATWREEKTTKEWRLPSDHACRWTVCESKHNVPVGWDGTRWSNSGYPTSGASSAQHADKQGGPPAYKK